MLKKLLAAITLAATISHAAAQEATPADAQTAPAEVSYLTGMRLLPGAVRPAGVEAQKVQSSYITQLSSILRDFYGTGNYCGTGELLAWQTDGTTNPFDAVEGTMNRLRAFGYPFTVDWEEPGLIIFTARSQRMNIFGAWGVYQDGAMLMWCRAEGPLRKQSR
ncbi:MAG TPA: hypothetical protein VNT60_01695 [Deinococcales bacterium]|nr:hypothetical protein [Deinococcales bacterium]